MLERKEILQTTSVALGFFVIYIFKMPMFLMVVVKNALKDTASNINTPRNIIALLF